MKGHRRVLLCVMFVICVLMLFQPLQSLALGSDDGHPPFKDQGPPGEKHPYVEVKPAHVHLDFNTDWLISYIEAFAKYEMIHEHFKEGPKDNFLPSTMIEDNRPIPKELFKMIEHIAIKAGIMKEVKGDLEILRKNTYDTTKQAVVDLNIRGTYKGRESYTEDIDETGHTSLKTTIILVEDENDLDDFVTYETVTPVEPCVEQGPTVIPKLIQLSI